MLCSHFSTLLELFAARDPINDSVLLETLVTRLLEHHILLGFLNSWGCSFSLPPTLVIEWTHSSFLWYQLMAGPARPTSGEGCLYKQGSRKGWSLCIYKLRLGARREEGFWFQRSPETSPKSDTAGIYWCNTVRAGSPGELWNATQQEGEGKWPS